MTDKRKSTRRKSKNKEAQKPLNWNNKRLQSVGNHFKFSDGRLLRTQIREIGTGKIFEQLVGQGYIKKVDNADKGTYKTTPKFQKQFNLNTMNDSSWGSSGGVEHSKVMYAFAKLLPEGIVAGGNFRTGTDISEDFKNIKRTKGFRENAEKMVNDKKEKIEDLKADYKKESASLDEKDKVIAKRIYEKGLKSLNRDLDILNEKGYKGYKAPDAEITFTREQLELFHRNYKKFYEESKLTNTVKRLMDKSLGKIETLLKTTMKETYTIQYEAITKNYSPDEIARGENYEEVTENIVIYSGSV